jgi:PadR family transcriptional regulator AphA
MPYRARSVRLVRQRTRAEPQTRTLTTTEAAVLALLAIEGERSGYDLMKLVGKAIGYVWSPARSGLYTVLPRLARAGLADVRHVPQAQRPDKQLYRITDAGRRALAEWHETIEPGATERFFLKLFVGGLTSRETLIEHVEQFRRDTESRLAELRAIEPTNTRRGHDYYHWFLLRLGIERRELDLRWADEVLEELRRGERS